MNKMVQIALALVLIAVLAMFLNSRRSTDQPGGNSVATASNDQQATMGSGDQLQDARFPVSNGADSSSEFPETSAAANSNQADRRPVAPVESFLIGTKGLRANEAQDVVSTSKFDLLFAKMQQELDAKSLEQTKLYRSSMQDVVATDNRFSVERIVCGHQLCAAEIASAEANEEDVTKLLLSDTDNTARRYATVQAMSDKPDSSNRYTFRMIFMTDKNLNSIEATYRP